MDETEQRIIADKMGLLLAKRDPGQRVGGLHGEGY